jgi:hypothetical protein
MGLFAVTGCVQCIHMPVSDAAYMCQHLHLIVWGDHPCFAVLCCAGPTSKAVSVAQFNPTQAHTTVFAVPCCAVLCCSRMLSGVEAGLNQAMDKLPDKVAEQVKGRLINRCGQQGVGVCMFHVSESTCMCIAKGVVSPLVGMASL